MLSDIQYLNQLYVETQAEKLQEKHTNHLHKNQPWITPSVDLTRISTTKKFVYLRVPKVASRSIIFGCLTSQFRTKSFNAIQGLKTLDEYFIWGFVRNPFDRIVSAFEFGKQTGVLLTTLTFEEFLSDKFLLENYWVVFHAGFQYPRFYNQDKKIADYIGKYENLESDWGYIQDKIGLKCPLRQMNKTLSRDIYQKYYNKKLIDRVKTIYKRDLELFEYSFE